MDTKIKTKIGTFFGLWFLNLQRLSKLKVKTFLLTYLLQKTLRLILFIGSHRLESECSTRSPNPWRPNDNCPNRTEVRPDWNPNKTNIRITEVRADCNLIDCNPNWTLIRILFVRKRLKSEFYRISHQIAVDSTQNVCVHSTNHWESRWC